MPLDHTPLSRRLVQEGLRPRQATGPDARGRYAYGKWWIIFDPPPIPYRGADWQFWHDDYDGPEDSRHGHAPSLEACLAEIDEREAEDRAA